jgi:hypothetical protein
MVKVKITIETKERSDFLKIEDKLIPLETERNKNGKWISSKTTIEVNEEALPALKELGETGGFKVTKVKK